MTAEALTRILLQNQSCFTCAVYECMCRCMSDSMYHGALRVITAVALLLITVISTLK